MFSEIRCLFGSVLLGVHDRVDDPLLPVLGHAAEIRLVADLEVQVVELVQLGDELLGQRFLDRQQVAVLVERVDVVARAACRRR